ncbi:MAG: protein kinase domain-containing protein [Vicinamibacteraceae bacterium]
MLQTISRFTQRCRALTARTWTHEPTFTIHDCTGAVRASGLSASRVGARPQASDVEEQPCGRTWGHLRLIELLGKGSFGEVHRAYDPQLDRQVALKLLTRRPGTPTKQTQRVLGEGRLLARLRHPNILAIHGVAEHDGCPGLWMELIKGVTLEDRLQRDGLSGSQEALLIGQDLCRALSAVHAAGVLHRDVKAQNVMREDGGRIVLMDFGTAEVQEAIGAVRRPRVAGTPLYLAPELLTGSPPSVQSDLYGVGVLLFYLATGVFPVQASSLADLCVAHADGRRTFLQDVRTDLPDAFVRVVSRALSPDPRDRYSSAGAMLAALAQAGGMEQTGHDHRNSPRAGLAALVGSTLLIGGLAAAWHWPSPTATASKSAAGDELRVLAVRPVLTGRPEADSLTRAVVEDVQRRLATSARWRVSSLQAVEVLNTPRQSAQAVMTTLNTDAVAEVRVRRVDGGLRGDIRLYRAGLGAQPVAATVAQGAHPVREFVETVAQRIVSDLQWQLESHRTSRQGQIAAVTPEARHHYLAAASLLHRYGVQNLEAALSEFRAAAEIEPTFALAHAMAARTILELHQSGALDPVDNPERMARQYIARALAQDESCAEAHAALAQIYTLEHRWEAADAAFRRALALSPSLESARTRYAVFLAGRGKLEDALAQVTEARSLDPNNAAILGFAGMIHHYRGEDEQAIARFRSALRTDPRHTHPHTGLCRVFSALGRVSEGVYHCGRAMRAGTLLPIDVEAQMVQLYVRAGDPERARSHMKQLRVLVGASPKPDAAYFLAIAHTALGQHDEALSYLALALEGGAPAPSPRVDPRLAALRPASRFETLVARAEGGSNSRRTNH